jgi:hypothetical protein
MGGEGRSRPDPPFSVPLPSARRRPSWPHHRLPTVPRRRDQTPPARPQGRRARLRPCTSSVHPAPATHWTPLSPPSWPIKAPSDHAVELTPLPASSQTPSLPPVRSRSLQPLTPASYWPREAPPRSASVGQADAGKWRRSAAGVFSTPRRQALLPLRASPSSSSLDAGELPPSPASTTQTRRWIRIQRQRTDSGDLCHLTRRPHLSVRFRTFPARAKRFLGRPVRVSSGFGPVQKDLVRNVFIYFPLVFELFKICFRYDFQTLIPRDLEIHF